MSHNRIDTQPQVQPDLAVQIGRVRLRKPVLLASGTCGYGPEYTDLLDFRRIGGLFTKSITLEPRKGNAPPRTVETSAGMLNAIGLANIGLTTFCRDKIPEIGRLIERVRVPGEPDLAVFANVAGHSVEEYVQVCQKLDEYPELTGMELNVSCPNVSDGLTFGTDPLLLGQLIKQVRGRVRRGLLVVKLSPNVTDICATARAAVDAGADALSLVNTYVGMAINIVTGRPILSNGTGGLSGPAIKPLAVCAVYKVYRHVAGPADIPLFGLGGIVSWQDAAEFVLAGASAVVVGTGTFVDPTIAGDLGEGLRGWLQTRGYATMAKAIGQASGR
jgi:dihydroorotate dehydrogenase (NAD+) catalytic subunit